MKAIVCTQYGSPDVLQLKEVDKLAPNDNKCESKSMRVLATSCHPRRKSVSCRSAVFVMQSVQHREANDFAFSGIP